MEMYYVCLIKVASIRFFFKEEAGNPSMRCGNILERYSKANAIMKFLFVSFINEAGNPSMIQILSTRKTH